MIWLIMAGKLPWRGILGCTYRQVNAGVLDESFFVLNNGHKILARLYLAIEFYLPDRSISTTILPHGSTFGGTQPAKPRHSAMDDSIFLAKDRLSSNPNLHKHLKHDHAESPRLARRVCRAHESENEAEVGAMGISPGDPVVPDSPFTVLNGTDDYVAKLGTIALAAAVVIEAMRRLQTQPHPNQIFWTITTRKKLAFAELTLLPTL
jgi:hypothetical protein